VHLEAVVAPSPPHGSRLACPSPTHLHTTSPSHHHTESSPSPLPARCRSHHLTFQSLPPRLLTIAPIRIKLVQARQEGELERRMSATHPHRQPRRGRAPLPPSVALLGPTSRTGCDRGWGCSPRRTEPPALSGSSAGLHTLAGGHSWGCVPCSGLPTSWQGEPPALAASRARLRAHGPTHRQAQVATSVRGVLGAARDDRPQGAGVGSGTPPRLDLSCSTGTCTCRS
jgi:hypothetical protein